MHAYVEDLSLQVVTPVRRSARKPARDAIPAADLLEQTQYAYTPNAALAPRMTADSAFARLAQAHAAQEASQQPERQA